MELRRQRRLSASPAAFLRRLVAMKESRRSLTQADLLALWEAQEGRCALTGLAMTHIRGRGWIATNASLDRIDSKRGYTRDNVRLVCAAVNLMRNRMTDDELVWWCKLILGKRRVKADDPGGSSAY